MRADNLEPLDLPAFDGVADAVESASEASDTAGCQPF